MTQMVCCKLLFNSLLHHRKKQTNKTKKIQPAVPAAEIVRKNKNSRNFQKIQVAKKTKKKRSNTPQTLVHKHHTKINTPKHKITVTLLSMVEHCTTKTTEYTQL